MELIITSDYASMNRKAADTISATIKEKPNCVLGLATGSTPVGTYKELVKRNQQHQIDFSQVITFNLDEYIGIGIDLSKPYSQDQSYARFMHEQLFSHINIKRENIHMPDGTAENLEKHCSDYEQKIKQMKGIDLQLLGIGANGHIAFNEPGSSLASRTRIQPLDPKTLNDNYEKFYKKAGIKKEDMPHYAFTMGVGTILESRHALLLGSGKNKAKAVAEAIEGPVTSKITASALQLHPGQVTIILDQPAASELTWSLKLVRENLA
ncbi:MAG: glucosamine-6-phosphate deaminase [Actinomycetia bacterium]|nr:glucosamine-6-phosphate deaminase [Actinomycetes bacterium]